MHATGGGARPRPNGQVASRRFLLVRISSQRNSRPLTKRRPSPSFLSLVLRIALYISFSFALIEHNAPALQKSQNRARRSRGPTCAGRIRLRTADSILLGLGQLAEDNCARPTRHPQQRGARSPHPRRRRVVPGRKQRDAAVSQRFSQWRASDDERAGFRGRQRRRTQ